MSTSHTFNIDAIVALSADFYDIDKLLNAYKQTSFLQLNNWQRFEFIHTQILDWIKNFTKPVFILPTLLDILDQINKLQLLSIELNLAIFEFWLNNYAYLNAQENYEIRGKITGKWIERSHYQYIFPIGTGKIYEGSHIVAAHLSPDIDTMTASFWGWMDAFSARLGNALHRWSLPGGPPKTPLTNLFTKLIHPSLFALCGQLSNAITINSLDLITHIDNAHRDGNSTLNHPTNSLRLTSNLDEIRQKMADNAFLSVTIPDEKGKEFPVGVIRAGDIHKHKLGTASLRDFCNLEEIKLPTYIQVISAIDHHRCSIKTLEAPTIMIADVQSANVLLAEQAFIINDKYSYGGISEEQLNKQIEQLSSITTTPSNTRVLQRLLQRRLAYARATHFYIHPKRELVEYLSFLYAILDDTDLLAKATMRDVDCVAKLLNRISSLQAERELEIINFDHLALNSDYTKLAVAHILQHKDVFAIYEHIYALRESETEQDLQASLNGENSHIFMDVKEQNGCARIGQTKLFKSNFPFFLAHATAFRSIWHDQSYTAYQHHNRINLHIHMLSTIANAQEMHTNKVGPYEHNDELWFWIAPEEIAIQNLQSFLQKFAQGCQELQKTFSFEFVGMHSNNYVQIFSSIFPEVPYKITEPTIDKSVAIVRFKAGVINSRKAMITPHLPSV